MSPAKIRDEADSKPSGSGPWICQQLKCCHSVAEVHQLLPFARIVRYEHICMQLYEVPIHYKAAKGNQACFRTASICSPNQVAQIGVSRWKSWYYCLPEDSFPRAGYSISSQGY
jgi:hypothetical protein